MYTINETTGEEYYFNLYEKWWHYFLLGFAYFIPHRLYKLKKFPKERVDSTKDISNNKDLNKWRNRCIITIPILVGILRVYQNIFIIDKPEEYVWLYGIVLYLSVVATTAASYILLHSRETKYDKDIFITIRMKLFSFATLKAIIWHVIILVVTIIVLFEIWYLETNFMILFFMVGVNLPLALLMISFGMWIKHKNENGELFKFGPII